MDTEIPRPVDAGSKGAVRARIAEIDDAIAAIRAQIAAADLTRQTTRRPIDPRWFHRAKTALRHLQRERSEHEQALAALPTAKETLKDSLIAILRERHEPDDWARILDEAHRRLHQGAA